MSTTVKDILATGIAKVATIATSRDDAEYYIHHSTNQPFEKAPASKRDGFEIVAREIELTGAFGILGEKEGQFLMVVRLGHSPRGTDPTREGNLAHDITRIADILEAYGAWPTGTQLVLYKEAKTDKRNANWWITEMMFQVVYTGGLQS